MTCQRGVGIFALVVCLLGAVATLLFACIHYHSVGGWWCLFVLPPLGMAFWVPAICLNYNKLDDALILHVGMERNKFENFRMLGWSVAGVLAGASYAVPLLVWYNSSGFRWPGVLVVYGTITFILWSYVLGYAIFIAPPMD